MGEKTPFETEDDIKKDEDNTEVEVVDKEDVNVDEEEEETQSWYGILLRRQKIFLHKIVGKKFEM